MSIGSGVVVAVALQKVDRAPHAEAGAQRHNEGLQNTDRTVEKCHKFVLLKDRGRSLCPARFIVVLKIQKGARRPAQSARLLDACRKVSGGSFITGGRCPMQ